MGDERIEGYVKVINQLVIEIGLSIPNGTKLYDTSESNSKPKLVAEMIWDNENNEYYARYVH